MTQLHEVKETNPAHDLCPVYDGLNSIADILNVVSSSDHPVEGKTLLWISENIKELSERVIEAQIREDNCIRGRIVPTSA